MNKYPKEISPLREPIKPADSIVDENGKFRFGTYSEPFKNLNMLDAKKPTKFSFTKALKLSRLKDWEAVEVAFDEGFLVCATYRAGFVAFNIMIFFDKVEKKVYSWQATGLPGKIKNHWTLINSVKSFKNKNSDYRIQNNFERGYVKFDGTIKNKNLGTAQINVEMQSFTDPSNVCIPFGPNQALYSHKEAFRVKGEFKFGNRVIKANDNTLGIIDDHKGYYPYKMHYYWVTGLGMRNINGEHKPFAFNLTQNQSIDPYNYNENLIWLEGKSYPLPPVKFTIHEDYWHAKDEYGYVDVKFYPEMAFKIQFNALVIRARYIAPSGRLEGYVKDLDGNKYDVAGLLNMGEDKKYVM